MNDQTTIAPRDAARARPDTHAARETLVAALPVTERRFELAGISTLVLVGGEGPPIVLLHGPAGHAAHWMMVIPQLVKTNRVVAPDLPGHGASRADPAALDAERTIAWLGALIAETCVEPPILVGQALGGALAARYASRHGKSIRRLVLVDTFGLQAFEPRPEFGTVMNAFFAQPDERSHELLWQQCMFDFDSMRRRVGAAWEPLVAYNVDVVRDTGARAALQSLMHAFGAPIAPDELRRIDVPTTLVWGRHDPAAAVSAAEVASREYGWPLHVIDDCGADPPIERPDEMVRALRDAETKGGRR